MTESNSTAIGIPRRYLRHIPLLASLHSKNLDLVQQKFQTRQYAAGETILRRGARGDFLGIVKTGRIDIRFQTPGGRSRMATLNPGSYFTLDAEWPSSAVVRAATPVTLWTLDRAEIARFDQRLPSESRSSLARRSGLQLLVTFSVALIAVMLIWVVLTSAQLQALLADLRYARGCWHLEQGQANAALREFDAALKMAPGHADIYNALGYVYYKQGQLERALVAFEQASRVAPDSDVIQNNLGLVYNHQGQTGKALESLRQAADLSNNVAQVYVNLGDLYLAERDWLNAGRAYREALRINPKLALTHHNLGVAYHRMGWLDDAHSEFDQAIQLDPNLEAAYVGLGVLAFEQRQFGRAQTAFRLAVELDPQDDVAYLYLGLAHKSLGRREQAVEAFERALGLTPDPVVREQAEQYLRELWTVP